MSCHDVGRALNNVVREVMTLYDEGRLDADCAKRVVSRCASSVHWCDGNENEATDYIRKCVCGRCFRKLPKGEPLYSIWEVSGDVLKRYDILDENGNDLPTDGLCTECFDIVINHHYGDENAGARERAYISEHSTNGFVSTGAYKDNNNGYRWPM